MHILTKIALKKKMAVVVIETVDRSKNFNRTFSIKI